MRHASCSEAGADLSAWIQSGALEEVARLVVVRVEQGLTVPGSHEMVQGSGLLANDFDYEGEALTLITASGPAHGSSRRW